MRQVVLMLAAGLACGGPPGAALAQKPPALAPEAPVAVPVGAAVLLATQLPMQAAGFNRQGLTDFEGRPGGQGLGAAADYRPADGSGGVATVYRYGRGLVGLPEGVGAPAVQAELNSALAEINAVAGLRRYAVVNPAEAAPIPAADGQPALRCVDMLLAYEGGARQADSFVCVGVLRGQFLKLRVTLPAARQGEAAPRVMELGRAVVAAVATAG